MIASGMLIKLYNAKDVAPAPGSISVPAKWLGIGVIVAAALLWIVLANTSAPPKPAVVTTVAPLAKTEAPQPAPVPQAPSPLLCQGEAFKTKNGLLVCGVYAVDNEYIWIQRGWIAPANNFTAAFRIFGDVSGCLFQIAGSRLVVECKSPIAVGRT